MTDELIGNPLKDSAVICLSCVGLGFIIGAGFMAVFLR